MRKAVLVLLVGASGFLAGCGNKPKDLIVGKWEHVEGNLVGLTMEFHKDGSLKMDVSFAAPPTVVPTAKSVLTVDGKYQFTDADHVEITTGERSVKAKVQVTKDELTLTDAEGKVSRLKRVQ